MAFGLVFTFHDISIQYYPWFNSYFTRVTYSVENNSKTTRQYYLRYTGNLVGNLFTQNKEINLGKNSQGVKAETGLDYSDEGTLEPHTKGGLYVLQFVFDSMDIEQIKSTDNMRFILYIQNADEENASVKIELNPMHGN